MSLIYTTLASDTFHRANENPVNPVVWSDDTADGIPACQILSDELVPTNIDESIAIYTGISWPNDQWAQLQIDSLNFIDAQEAAILLVMRRSDAADGIAWEIDGPLGDSCGVAIWFENDHTQTFILGSSEGDAFVSLHAGDTIRMECLGNTCTAYINGVQIAQGSNTIPASGNVAIDLFGNSSVTDTQVSNFSGGSITNMATVATPVITLAAGFYAGSQTTTITCATGSSTIFYTTDGTTPTHTAGVPNGTTQIYTTTLTIAASETIKALGYLLGDTDSAVASSAFNILAITSVGAATIDVIGGTVQLTGGVVTGGITNVTDWLTSNSGVATVGSTGLVTAVAAGTATITARADELHSLTVTATITVGSIGISDVNLMQSFLANLLQSMSTASPFVATQQTRITTALANLRKNSLTESDLQLIQSLLNYQVQTLGTNNPFQSAEQLKYVTALADVRSLL